MVLDNVFFPCIRHEMLGNARYPAHGFFAVTTWLFIPSRVARSSSNRAASEFPIYFPQLPFPFAFRRNLQSV